MQASQRGWRTESVRRAGSSRPLQIEVRAPAHRPDRPLISSNECGWREDPTGAHWVCGGGVAMHPMPGWARRCSYPDQAVRLVGGCCAPAPFAPPPNSESGRPLQLQSGGHGGNIALTSGGLSGRPSRGMSLS
jgi:hypothetical protein